MKHILMPARMLGVALAACILSTSAIATQISVFSENFESGTVPSAFSGAGTITGTQGYSAHGFGSNMLRNDDGPNPNPLKTTLSLTGLASHTSIDLNFLVAIINSWDGSNGTQNDRFNVSVDGTSIFSELFTNPLGTGSSFTPETGVALAGSSAPGANLFTIAGDNPGWKDSAYNMGLQTAAFDGIAHTASTLTIDFFATGIDDIPGGNSWSGGADESWAIDNVEVVLNSTSVPEPSTLALLSLSLIVIGGRKRKVH